MKKCLSQTRLFRTLDYKQWTNVKVILLDYLTSFIIVLSWLWNNVYGDFVYIWWCRGGFVVLTTDVLRRRCSLAFPKWTPTLNLHLHFVNRGLFGKFARLMARDWFYVDFELLKIDFYFFNNFNNDVLSWIFRYL